jgi:hypothetical protein
MRMFVAEAIKNSRQRRRPEVFGYNGARVTITEVDLFADFFGNPTRQRAWDTE